MGGDLKRLRRQVIANSQRTHQRRSPSRTLWERNPKTQGHATQPATARLSGTGTTGVSKALGGSGNTRHCHCVCQPSPPPWQNYK